MYLPLETTFAIFVGGMIRWVVNTMSKRRRHNEAQAARVENAGVLAASGLIAGEALMGLFVAAIVFFRESFWQVTSNPFGLLAVIFALGLASYLVFIPLSKAGAADEPAPPTAVM